SLLAAPLAVAPGVHVVLELFDKQAGAGKPAAFTDEDHRLVRAAADVGAELLRHALAQRQTRQVLFDAVAPAPRPSGPGARGPRGRRPRAAPPPGAGGGRRRPPGGPGGGGGQVRRGAPRGPPPRPCAWPGRSASCPSGTPPPPCSTAPAWWRTSARCSTAS